MNTPNSRVRYGWGIYGPSGELRHVGLYDDEREAWEIYLGWPSYEEIKDRQAEGFKAAKVAIAPI